MSSSGGGIRVFLFENAAEFVSVIKESLVSRFLVASSLGDGSLCGDASIEVANFVLKGDGAFFESGNVSSVSILLGSEQLDGVIVFIAEFSPCVLEVVSQVLEEADKSLNVGSVDISLGERDSGEGGENSRVDLGLSE